MNKLSELFHEGPLKRICCRGFSFSFTLQWILWIQPRRIEGVHGSVPVDEVKYLQYTARDNRYNSNKQVMGGRGIVVTADEARQVALSMPEAEEHDHWGKPSFRVRNKIFAVIQEDGVSLVVKCTRDDRAAYTTLDPDVYSVPTSFSNLNYMVVRMDLIPWEELQGIIIQAWRCVSPKRLIAAYDAAASANYTD